MEQVLLQTSKNTPPVLNYVKAIIVKAVHGDFPSGPVVKNLPDNAGHTNSIPGPGTKIPYTLEQLIP